MILPLDLSQEFLDVVQIHSGFQPHLVGSSVIRPTSWGSLNRLQSEAQRFIYHAAEGRIELCRNRFRFVQNIVVYGQCCSHIIIIASDIMMSRHQIAYCPSCLRPEDRFETDRPAFEIRLFLNG